MNYDREQASWLDRSILYLSRVNPEVLLLAVIMLTAVFSRLFILGARVMSHDEINHVYFAWTYFNGSEYIHHALSHGPFQFHILYLSYFLLGVSDFSARIPAALFSIAAVYLAWKFRRYIGRAGGLAAAALFVISPFLLYYGRYARNEAFVVVWGLAMLWSLLRYLETGENKHLYTLAVIISLHLATKETAFIYVAQALLFLGFLFLQQIEKRPWQKPANLRLFNALMLLTALLLVLALSVPGFLATEDNPQATLMTALFAAGGVSFVTAFIVLLQGYTWQRLLEIRSFELMLFIGALILPHLAAFPLSWFGGDPMDYQNQAGLLKIVAALIPLFIISIAVGLQWKPQVFLTSLALFYSIFIPLFTSFFTNGFGFFSGMMGSLGYWVEQQGVERGSQPWFYYLALQVPFYEFMAAIGTIGISILGLGKLFSSNQEGKADLNSQEMEQRGTQVAIAEVSEPSVPVKRISFLLLVFWCITSLVAYTLAGEKMPWLTVHIAWPMLLLTGWGIGVLIAEIDWQAFKHKHGLLAMGTTFLLISSLILLAYNLSTLTTIAQFSAIEKIKKTSGAVFAGLFTAGSTFCLWRLLRSWSHKQILYVFSLGVFGLLALLTARSAIIANYINYDLAKEYLVYAHSGPGPKAIFNQIEDLSLRTTGSRDIKVAFDNFSAYPFWWYLRDYPNQNAFGEEPTRQLRDYPVILAGDANYGKVEPIVGQGYESFEYVRMWWPNQDYFDANFILDYLKNPETRWKMAIALFNIWLNRDYQPYADVTSRDITLQNWNPANKMRMYVRKDVLAGIWDYGLAPGGAETVELDLFEENYNELTPVITLGEPEAGELVFQGPHDIDFAPDGTLYIADTDSNQILHITKDGDVLHQWGTYGVPEGNEDAEGLFNQPWGIAVDQSGIVYVADTWNHRIQKFSSNGKFIDSWGIFGQDGDPFSLYGPRDIETDDDDNLLVTDTGNKRITIYSTNGDFLDAFGTTGFGEGQFDEQVGLAFDHTVNRLYVTDTWNQRIQAFAKTEEGYEFANSWDVSAWYGQSLANKPYIAVRPSGDVYAADPEVGLILVYQADGTYIATLGNDALIGSVAGLAFDHQGNLWLTDSIRNLVYSFEIPELE